LLFAGMRRAVIATLVLFSGCATGGEDEGSSCAVGTDSEPLARACYPEPLGVVTDPEAGEYGRVPCVVIAAARSGTSFCDCARPGFRAATAEQADVAREQLEVGALCEGTCCDDYCFCELLQLSGNALAACQDRASSEAPAPPTNGWCYIEPAAGFGDPSRIADCPSVQPQLVRFVPESVIADGQMSIVACRG
jgi:hypothetical protein